MPEKPLSDAAVNAGKDFLVKLDEFGLYPESAAWLYAPSLGDWRYIVATSAVDVVGRRKLYGGILDILETVNYGDALTEADVHLVSPLEDWYDFLRRFIRIESASGLIVEDSNFNGMTISAVIYRFFAPPKENELRRRSDKFVKAAQRAREYVRT